MSGLEGLSQHEKEEMVVSLSVLVCADSSADISEENMNAVIKASGNSVAAHWVPVFASCLEKTGGVSKFLVGPGSGGGGGGGGGGAAAGAPAAAEEEKKEEEEEEEIDMGGGMDMFGGDDEGGGDDY
mmetsp:Transcript_22493/g.30764  ORF Transcript_22493/g.30764 Transcript_22493/m.30764 type:complete len:127 (-) Transcript_22493:508-888(-)|eukprot:CAMPEP_0185765284 /NCGR_PEP_ID=MMETSP1174-20130828/28238_1 /TAXON_ID=35687 /ORGANISM="Dictyocha speculum, Strain CCMP1381" /LENGTH=126 /DNA_ID=CAMNT_0028448315 /DNA_START=38 /DNA_END=418 /DNA_ORIENTATION=+